MLRCSVWDLLCIFSSMSYTRGTTISAASISGSSTANRKGRTGTTIPESTVSNDGSIAMPAGNWISPPYEYFFENPLPIASVKSPKYCYEPEDTTKAPIDFYEVGVKTTHKQIYPNLGKTELVAYDGESPGPVFMMQQGREAVVRFTNKGPFNMSVHVHGQYNRAPFDGWAADFAQPGQYKDYYYPNTQNARTAWYHDHTEFATGEQAYRGQTGTYIITDSEEQSFNLPKGKYDVGLTLESKLYHSDGSLRYVLNNNLGLWGDIIQVNGQPWPYLKVEPRKYRLRFLNGAVSRTFEVFFAKDEVVDGEYKVGKEKALDFDVIGADAGLLTHPVNTSTLRIAMGERYEVVVDFANFANSNLTLRNKQWQGENIDYAATDMVMRFVVGDSVSDSTNNGPLPSKLRSIPLPNIDVLDKKFTFERVNENWVINGVGWADIDNRILTRPTRGEDEIWEMHNGNEIGTHPVHIHLVDFSIISRKGGRNKVLPYEAAGLKDVVWLAGGETIRVVARYAPWNGVYMFHCHNLIHEDHEMMVAFNVTNLEKWGYNESTIFIDPLQPEFRPKDIDEDAYTREAIMDKMEWFFNTDAYNHGNVAEVYDALDDI